MISKIQFNLFLTATNIGSLPHLSDLDKPFDDQQKTVTIISTEYQRHSKRSDTW